MKPIVGIDGPAGAGKSTVARLVAARLGYTYIDTGAMYRSVALKAIRAGVGIDSVDEVVRLADVDIVFQMVDGLQRVLADGEDVTDAIRTAEVTALVSPVSAIPAVREKMVAVQRSMAKNGGVVMEGRDIGTVVFPNAQVKVFLTASPEARARRRTLELRDKGIQADETAIAEEIRQRDARDSSRDHSPLVQAPDAVLVDTDDKGIEQVVAEVIAIHDSRVGEPC
jgi:CMP/dCMP kinase